MKLNISGIVGQLEELLKAVTDMITNFIEQNLGFLDQIIRTVSDFIAWLEGLVTF